MRRAVLGLLIPLLTACATPLHQLPPDEATAICQFLKQRAQQGDFLGCYLAAQRAASAAPKYGRPINPAVTVDAVMTWDRYGSPTGLSGLTTSLPNDISEPPLNCFRDALRGTQVPPPGKHIRVPVRFVLDGWEPVPSLGVPTESGRCLVGPGAMDR